MKLEKCFYVRGSTEMQDAARLVDGIWKGFYSGETLEQMRERVPEIELRDINEVVDEIDAANVAAYCHPPKKIDAERYDDLLNVLPPCAWTRHAGAECFYISEAWTADLHQWCVKLPDSYWSLTRSRFTPPAEIIAEVARHAKGQTH